MTTTIISAESFIDDAGWNIDRLIADIDGHDVQVVRYNGNDNAVCVMVDNCMAQMDLHDVSDYVNSKL